MLLESLAVKELLRRFLPRRFKHRITAWAFDRLHLSCVLRSRLTIEIKNRGDWWVFTDLWANGEYDFPINLALDRLPASRPLQVVDLGANVGMFTFRLFDLMHERGIPFDRVRVVMVEASPSCCVELARRMKQIPSDCYEIVNGLVGQRSGIGHLDESDEPVMNKLARSGTSVPFVDLESYVLRADLLKCDVEGSEEAFLSSYPQLVAQTDVAVFELHPSCDAQHCRSLLPFPNFKELRRFAGITVEAFWR